eukprot:scaffold27077_cov15-Tisochrysis_lutea.AAC.2
MGGLVRDSQVANLMSPAHVQCLGAKQFASHYVPDHEAPCGHVDCHKVKLHSLRPSRLPWTSKDRGNYEGIGTLPKSTKEQGTYKPQSSRLGLCGAWQMYTLDYFNREVRFEEGYRVDSSMQSGFCVGFLNTVSDMLKHRKSVAGCNEAFEMSNFRRQYLGLITKST